MNERWLENPRRDGSRPSRYVTTLLVGGAGLLFLVGVGAAYSVALASTGALAAMATVLVTIGLAGLLVLAGAVAARRVRPPFVPTRPVGDPDAELLRILDDVRFGDLKLGLRAPLCERRGTA